MTVVRVQEDEEYHLVPFDGQWALRALCGLEKEGPWVMERPGPVTACMDCFGGGNGEDR